jgi:hypothetical protein
MAIIGRVNCGAGRVDPRDARERGEYASRMIAGVAGLYLRAAFGKFWFWSGYVRRALRRFLKAMRRDRLAAV